MITIKAFAKINLSLDVLNKRTDGYHNLKMIMQSVDLHDTIYIRESKELRVKCQHPDIPENSGNIAWKAAEQFFFTTGIKRKAEIIIEKRIPVAAGLAGGSSNAAAVLVGLNKLYNTGIMMEDLAGIGRNVGADVPYCIYGGTRLAEGIGEKLTLLPAFNDIYSVLVKPDIFVSTAWVYNRLNLNEIGRRPDTEQLIKCLYKRDFLTLAKGMVNVLETVTIEEYPVIREIKQNLIGSGAMGSIMSGSGPSVFGLFEDRRKAEEAFRLMKDKYIQTYLVSTIEGRG